MRQQAQRTTATGSNKESQGSMPSTSQGSGHHGSGNCDAHSLALTEDVLCGNPFMKAPSREVIDDRISSFIDCTSNPVLDVGVCAVCAQETKESELTQHCLDLIPNPQHLRPAVTHSAHNIYNGMLLHPAGLINHKTTNLCTECARALNSDKIPSFALANGMWIGATPHE